MLPHPMMPTPEIFHVVCSLECLNARQRTCRHADVVVGVVMLHDVAGHACGIHSGFDSFPIHNAMAHVSPATLVGAIPFRGDVLYMGRNDAALVFFAAIPQDLVRPHGPTPNQART